MYEELLADADDTLPTVVPQLRVARLAGQPGQAARTADLVAWADMAAVGSSDALVRSRLQVLVTEYREPARQG